MRFNKIINEGISHHLDNNIPLHECVYRLGSDAYFKFFRDARTLYEAGELENLHWFDEEILRETSLGEFVTVRGEGRVPLDMIIDEHEMALHEAEYNGRDVELDKPKRGGSKAYYVYTKSDAGNVIKVEFGSSSPVHLDDPEKRKNYASRHNCEKTKDKTKPGYWSCRLPRYAKSLGLSGGGRWW